MEDFDYKKFFSKRRLTLVLWSVVLGLLVMALFSGKKSIYLGAAAVSPNEQYIACNESYVWLGKSGRREKILCFQTDGALAFQFDIPSEMSDGGTCTLWFEQDVLCVLFYRTDKIVRFAMDGTIQSVIVSKTEEYPPEFPSFAKKGRQYIYSGTTMDVIYDEGSFLGYWFFGAERRLEVLPKNGEAITVWTAAAT